MRSAIAWLVLAPALAHAEVPALVFAHAEVPIRVAILANGGGWVTGHSERELQGGAEVALTRALGDLAFAGGGVVVAQYELRSDECYGSTGQIGEAFGTIGVHGPVAGDGVDMFVATRAGVYGRRIVPSCSGAPVDYQSLLLTSLVVGVDLGGARRLRLQVGVAGFPTAPNPPIEVTGGVGVTF